MAYTRFFMPLENEAAGYDFKGRTPAGRCIVEIRDGTAKLSVLTQDIRAETRYGVYLIFPENGRYAGVSMGSLNADQKGKAEMRKDIESSALGSFKLDDLAVVAVIDSSNTTTVASPLCGYRDRPISWRGNFYIPSVEKDEIKNETVHKSISTEPQLNVNITEEIIPEPEIETVPEAETVPEVECQSEPEIIPEDNIVENIEPDIEMDIEPETITVPQVEAVPEVETAQEDVTAPEVETTHEIETVKETVVAPEDVTAPEPEPEISPPCEDAPCAKKPKSAKPARRAIAQDFFESLNELNNVTLANSPGRTENILAIESIFNSKEFITPFEKQNRKIKWVQLTISDPVPLPNNRPLLLEESFVRAAYANYGHLILGVTTDGVEYVIGVPGEYTPDMRPHAKRLGFTKFKTNANSTPKPGDLGYWLMFINM